MILKKSTCFILLLILIAAPMMTMNVSAADTNIALNKSYTIEYDSPIENAYPNFVQEDSGKKLTNGKKSGASPAASDSAWLRLYRGTTITVTIDLGGVFSVNKVNLTQLNINAAGINCSRYLYASVSEDGEKFGTVGEIIDTKSVTDTSISKINRNFEFDGYYKARYVRVAFSSDVWVYIDEIEVIGTDDASLGKSAPIDGQKQFTNAFPTDVNGLRNIMLMYCGKYLRGSVSNVGSNRYDHLLPFFAYLDSGMKPVDKMFDGMLFLPLQPNASKDDESADYSFAKLNGWQYYLDSVIGTDGEVEENIAALNTVVGENKTNLGYAEDYKYPVYISVPYIEKSDTVVFGEVDGELIVPSTLESRLKIVEWFIDKVISSFNAAKFEHIQLNGFYWHNEVVPYAKSEFEDDLIMGFNAYVHSKDYSSIWIPYYCAPGYETWRELGFDAAVLQNGYAFLEYENDEIGERKPGLVDDALGQAKKYGLGLEMEISGLLSNGDSEAYKRLLKIVNTAYTTGVMENGLTMYYQGGGPGTLYSCAKSNKPTSRAVYDLVYKYVSRKFTSYIPVVEKDQFIIVKKGGEAAGKLKVTDEDTAPGILKTHNLTPAKNVEVKVDGYFFLVTSKSVFVGEDSFKVSLSDGYNVSEEVSVKVYVVEDALPIKSINSKLKDNSANIYNEPNTQTGTDENTYEVVVDSDKKIIEVGGYNHTVPDGGFVIAAKGESQQYLLSYAKIGESVLHDALTDTVFITGNKVVQDESDIKVNNGNKTLLYVILAGSALFIAGVGLFIIK
ncbi:MAG TPA: hypothetical protein DD733_02280, partial [Clostridiales bacterium]|nr:hypothetical protein [Clostridiales bacterium]